jgi:hypothetical protein
VEFVGSRRGRQRARGPLGDDRASGSSASPDSLETRVDFAHNEVVEVHTPLPDERHATG